MAKSNKADMSCARVKKYTASDVSKAERHNERKNETYENMNVIEERIPYNVHFKKPVAPTYMEQLKRMETDGMVSLRGLRKDATLFNEIVIDDLGRICPDHQQGTADPPDGAVEHPGTHSAQLCAALSARSERMGMEKGGL